MAMDAPNAVTEPDSYSRPKTVHSNVPHALLLCGSLVAVLAIAVVSGIGYQLTRSDIASIRGDEQYFVATVLVARVVRGQVLLGLLHQIVLTVTHNALPTWAGHLQFVHGHPSILDLRASYGAHPHLISRPEETTGIGRPTTSGPAGLNGAAAAP